MRAGDSWEDLHGTKDRPGREVSAARARQLSALAAEHGEEDPHFAAAVDWSSSTKGGAGPSSEGAGPSSEGAAPAGDDDERTVYAV